ncbi:sensor histidine kinase [Wenxinia marina]|uniref:histidine kinase n=1 Tax=Wenxinia marina DSM 24838 TaxID=1123501 RepID=A0A0D0Q9L3_9RHOB|nr:ATP-binding protein [Wenxinia marina]KIQ67708.1 His Kinase A (phospho-acceptor) domain protein/PAS fold protein/Histidine kinase-, DNA gyrase B [Wenxinia marina DSM 24838]GGL77753.1 two-component sensor histidine kinase [Wenxinia marina]
MHSVDPEHLLAALPQPILLIGPDERIVAMNRAAQRLFGGGGVGRHYITAIRQPAVLDAVEAALRGEEPAPARYLAGDGGGDATWRAVAAPLPMGPRRGVALTFEDITDFESAGRMRRDFVANVSHELRTPLTAVLGFVETLKGPARSDPAASGRFLELLEREAGRMARLVADLLSLSRVEENERLRPRTPVGMAALIQGVAETLASVASADEVTLSLDLPEGEVLVPGDEGQLRQVVTNLVENAIKYGGRGRTVTVTLGLPGPESALRGDGVRVTVSDEGEGIAAHHIPRLTERFYRVDGHRGREVGGTGLGLAIVKHIVNRHRGRLRIESKPGQGSRFTVILPAMVEG